MYVMDIKNIKLPEIVLPDNKEVAIFGTKELGSKYFEQIEKKYGNKKICFFIDSNNTEKFFHQKKVIRPVELAEDEHKNERYYIIASASKILIMENILLSYGINKEYIIEPVKRCSVEFLKDCMKSIKKIAFYPVVTTEEQLRNLINKVLFYWDDINFSDIQITFFSSKKYNYNKNYKFKIKIISNCKSIEMYDAILVWDKEVLYSKELAEIRDGVYCIDEHLVEFQDTKMFAAINNKILGKKQINKYMHISKSNWETIEQYANKKEMAYVFGTGPSMGGWVKKHSKGYFDNSITIVCNAFHNNLNIIDIINPDLYVISDPDFFAPKLSEALNNIIYIIKNSKCILVLPSMYLHFVYYKYNLDKNKIIGLEFFSKEIIFPKKDKLEVYNSMNVITSFSLPIASSLCNKIGIVGCDGRDGNFKLQHSKYIIGDESKNFENHEKDIDPDKSRVFYYEHCTYWEKIILFGESLGKKYYSLTSSYIPALKERYNKFISS